MNKQNYDSPIKRNHRVVIRNFFGNNNNLEAWQLGWDLYAKIEARSSVSKKIFNFYVVDMAMNIIFYYTEDGNFYGIHAETSPTPVFRFNKDLTFPYVIDQLQGNTHDYPDCSILYWVEQREEIWEQVTINGKHLEEILAKSYIVNVS